VAGDKGSPDLARDVRGFAVKQVDGSPSVLFDAVAILPSEDGVDALLSMPPARDFVADAFAHNKFVAWVGAAQPLLDKAGVEPDEGFVELTSAKAAKDFVVACRGLRFWDRELAG